MIPVAKRDKYATIQTLVETVTIGGEITETAQTFCRAWVGIRPLNSREKWIAQQSQALTTHEITMPYVSGITTDMQLVWNGRTFRFEGVVNEDEANIQLVITAREVTNDD